ncbi:TonB-dependent receptor domain-containing protein [Aquimarina hainanensis]|uniref:TonB-dependent receptor domain-containing protein n=2 Tax=Aquimarina hainanensis TaxID=1578017 RepID=A0ABW5N3W2_9FLAO
MFNYIKIVVYFILTSCTIPYSYAQGEPATITGTVTDTRNNGIEGITALLRNTNHGAYTDVKGTYSIYNIAPGAYVLEVSGLGYKKQLQTVSLSEGEKITLNITLETDLTAIDEVTVTGKSKTTRIKEQSFAVNSISTKQLKNNTTDASVILNKTSGIRIRSTGGLGSSYKLSLNGLTDKQIRVFVDDIPIDELGEAYSLNNISVNLIERIDVYKGVVPVSLGADALGGAINIITNKKKASFFDVSHSVGSFNTHRFNLNSQYRAEKSGFTVKVSGIYNYSDNNYLMRDVNYFVKETVIQNGIEREIDTEVTGDVERFHDQYRSVLGNIGLGFTNTQWADALIVDFAAAGIDREIQGLNNRPIGEATEEEHNQTVRLRYTKSRIFDERLSLDIFALYNTIKRTSIDTSSNRYSWDGSFKVNEIQDGRGEFLQPKTLFKFNQSQFQYRVHANYNISEGHTIGLNHIYSEISREGENRINTEENQPFKSPNTIKKAVSGFAYTTTFFDQKLESVLALKHYYFKTLAKQAITFTDSSIGIEDVSTIQDRLGYSFSTRYFITPDLLLKGSYEKGYRIPQPKEIFGDGLSILAVPGLQPEISKNINLGIGYTYPTDNGFLKNEVHLFRRDVKNFIRFQFSGLVNSYQNEEDVLIRGVEWDLIYQYKKLRFSGNLTWQQVLNNQDFPSGSIEERVFEKQQLPNTPSLFANADISYQLPNLIRKVNTSVYYGVNFVDKFYVAYKKAATLTDKNEIPTQFLNNAGITFSSTNGKHNVNIEVQNIFDASAYDNFRQSKPGSAFYLKYRFFLDN